MYAVLRSWHLATPRRRLPAPIVGKPGHGPSSTVRIGVLFRRQRGARLNVPARAWLPCNRFDQLHQRREELRVDLIIVQEFHNVEQGADAGVVVRAFRGRFDLLLKHRKTRFLSGPKGSAKRALRMRGPLVHGRRQQRHLLQATV